MLLGWMELRAACRLVRVWTEWRTIQGAVGGVVHSVTSRDQIARWVLGAAVGHQ